MKFCRPIKSAGGADHPHPPLLRHLQCNVINALNYDSNAKFTKMCMIDRTRNNLFFLTTIPAQRTRHFCRFLSKIARRENKDKKQLMFYFLTMLVLI